MKRLLLLPVLLSAACASTPPPPPPPPAAPPPTAPSGPTRTDFKEIAGKLMKRCVAGGWINTWRSQQANIDAARPKIHLAEFEDKTGQDLDSTYLHRTLEQKMRLSGVYDMQPEAEGADFIGKGKLLRMAERGKGGARFSVYTAVLDLVDPASGKVAYTCEATVEGEM
ncbi:MAG: hypothetical protein H6730_23575 [Deltaproteobacteria bacterium]|nr:hypothetical protein [Deltaproteobacteria bacterium]